MIRFPADELFNELQALAQREGQRVAFRRAVMAIFEAGDEAEERANGRREDEPAAVLYAFGRRSAAFQPAARRFIGAVVRAQAAASGFELEVTDLELIIFSARLARGEIDFPELRDSINRRLRPFGQKPKRPPPRRQP